MATANSWSLSGFPIEHEENSSSPPALHPCIALLAPVGSAADKGKAQGQEKTFATKLAGANEVPRPRRP
jgi:hypothetical protein